jgi:hypothetical protein
VVLLEAIAQVAVYLDGLTITGGVGKSDVFDAGSAIRFVGPSTSHVTMSNCVVTNNVSTSGAVHGGITADSHEPVLIISDSVLKNNSEIGIFVNGGTTLIQNVQISDNSPPTSATAIFVSDQTVYIVGTTISNNYSEYLPLIRFGGVNGGTLYMWNNRIVGNYGKWEYMSVYGGDIVSINDIFSGNKNESGQGGGAMYLNRGNAMIVNDVFAFNYAGGAGGAIRSEVSDVKISNTIFFQNVAPIDPDISDPYGGTYGTIEINHSLFDRAVPSSIIDGGGITLGDPLFVDPDGPDDIPGTLDDDFRLLAGSPAIDAGANESLPPDFLDIDGDGDTSESWPFDILMNQRIFVGSTGKANVDLGAIEFGSVPTAAMSLEDVEIEMVPRNDLLIYPSPAYTRATIIWNRTAIDDAELSLYDVSGKLVSRIDKGMLFRLDQIELDVSNLPSGVYFVRESTTGSSGRLVVIH